MKKKYPPPTPERLEQLRAMRYVDYLKSPEWNRRRQVALTIADHKCQLCNSGLDLQVHHRDYSRLGQERMTDLIVLCNLCHQAFHERRSLVRSV